MKVVTKMIMMKIMFLAFLPLLQKANMRQKSKLLR
nr:MAG TPA: hypothetical protein [Caudoviricetes sp.]